MRRLIRTAIGLAPMLNWLGCPAHAVEGRKIAALTYDAEPGGLLLRCDESYGSGIRNNRLTNLSDTARCANPFTSERAGLEAPLKFECGANSEVTVDGWKVTGPK